LESAPQVLPESSPPKVWDSVIKALYIVGALLLFLFALDLMISSLQHAGSNVAETIIEATSNPFTALFIGLLVTAMIQSSSTTTSLVVALVASGSITLQSAIPIIMGANIGTTITSTIVALGFMGKRKEFRRAVAAGTYHDFFNILTAVLLFPLEYYYGFLSGISQSISAFFFTPSEAPVENIVSHFSFGFGIIITWMIEVIPIAILIIISFVLLFSSILLFRKFIANWMAVRSPERFSKFFFKNPLKSFGWGMLITAGIRSSTITTSLVVPLVAKKVVTLKNAAPFIMGANIGTTITAFIAAMLNSNTGGAISIAIAHFLFNFIGVLLFFPVPALRQIPMELASGLGRLTLRYRLAGLLYLLLSFFFIPFSLIYFNKDTLRVMEITYRKTDSTRVESYYRVVSSLNMRTESGEWITYAGAEKQVDEMPTTIYPVSFKNNSLFAGKSLFLFNKPGFCWDGEDDQGKYEGCVEKIHARFGTDAEHQFDSVYQCSVKYETTVPDSLGLTHRYFISAPLKIVVRHDVVNRKNETLITEEAIRYSPK
jgi:solute carrier family 34 (sodium-dependent phosphate cotransporter)